MSDQFDFGDGTWEQAAPVIRMTLENLDHTVNGNGKPGIKADVAELRVIAATSLKWVRGIGIALGIAIAAMGVYVAYLQINHRVSRSDQPSAETQNQSVPQTTIKE